MHAMVVASTHTHYIVYLSTDRLRVYYVPVALLLLMLPLFLSLSLSLSLFKRTLHNNIESTFNEVLLQTVFIPYFPIKMPNGWRTIKLLVHRIRLYGRRGKGMAESFSREKLRHAPQKEGG